ncbi:hypothetical protein [Novosphingobium sp.]|uniref:hypothetical protein n=1 Tax=Novosphingobium sp. TaxID=1874826 RepID=UPI003B517A7C
MKIAGAALALSMALFPSVVTAQVFDRQPSESAESFADRVLRLPKGRGDAHVLAAKWNGRDTIFVDYLNGDDRDVVALIRQDANAYRKIAVTTGEVEGGNADVVAIGFANADHDSAQELIVILSWPVQHYDINGTLYDVRIFDDVHPGQTRLTYLKAASARFGANSCDCEHRDGKPERYRFKTIADVKARLKHDGF